MARLFGTDGIRGIANTELTPELVFSVGYAHGIHLRKKGCARPRLMVGRDTRISGELLECSYAAGLCAAGADVILLGVIPTPAVAWYITQKKADGGGVISASHNPVKDNGIKLLGPQGFKLSDAEEDILEDLISRLDTLERLSEGQVGRIFHCEQEAEDAYVEYLIGLSKVRLEGQKFVIDCANGASSAVAPRVFRGLGADITVLNAEPDGLNINRDCGSTHLNIIQKKVVEVGAQFGLAFDGDADRCLAVDENGNVVDGDPLLLIFGRYLREQKSLPGDYVITTVMANLGLEEALQAEGMKMIRTNVGDRYVLAEMLSCGGKLGGEQSGHIIFLDHATTGDGVLTGVMLAQILAQKKRSLADLATDCHKKPQLLVNVRVKDKHHWREYPEVETAFQHVESTLQGKGRLLVRPSGTENLLRLMAEGPDQDELNTLLQGLKATLEKCCPPQDTGKSVGGPDVKPLALAMGKLAPRVKKLNTELTALKGNDWNAALNASQNLHTLADELGVWAKEGRKIATQLEKYAAAERQTCQTEFNRQLQEEAQNAGLTLTLITQMPLEYRLGKFTLVVNLGAGKVDIQYCRMSVEQMELNAAALIERLGELEDWLNGATFEAEACFMEILTAYKRRLILENKPLGERVDLVNLVPEIAFQRQVSATAKKKVKGERPYDKIQFAWDLMRMWRTLHGLTCQGRRLNLGTATINSTKNKQSVLFLEEGGTHGQYYLSAWFTK